jgi:hypothetical protein
MVDVGYRIDDSYQIGEGARPGSNDARRFIAELLWLNPVRLQPSSSGASELTAGRFGCSPEMGGYGAPFATRFLPMASRHCGEPVLLTLGRRDGLHWAGDDDVLHSYLDGNRGLLRCFSGLEKSMNNFLSTSPSFSRWRIGSGGDEFLYSKDFLFLGLQLILGKI